MLPIGRQFNATRTLAILTEFKQVNLTLLFHEFESNNLFAFTLALLISMTKSLIGVTLDCFNDRLSGREKFVINGGHENLLIFLFCLVESFLCLIKGRQITFADCFRAISDKLLHLSFEVRKYICLFVSCHNNSPYVFFLAIGWLSTLATGRLAF